MAVAFSKATKSASRLRLAIIGPAGSGKTYSSLAIAKGLGDRVAVIDTERGSAAKYADLFAFDVLTPESFAPATYIEAIKVAEAAGYDTIVIDSLSHAWMGKGGALEQVDNAAKRSSSNNSFTAWRDVTPQHNALVDAMLQCSCHVIATMRTKTEYVLEEDIRGKKIPKKIGLAPVQRDGLEYEFDVVGTMTEANEFIISKTRCPSLVSQVISKPGSELAATLKAWLSDGVKSPEQQKSPSVAAPKPNPGTPPQAPAKAATGGSAAQPAKAAAPASASAAGLGLEGLRGLAAKASVKHTNEVVRAKIKAITGAGLAQAKPEQFPVLEKMLKELINAAAA